MKFGTENSTMAKNNIAQNQQNRNFFKGYLAKKLVKNRYISRINLFISMYHGMINIYSCHGDAAINFN